MKIEDGNGKVLFEIDEKLKDGIKRMMRLCDEKFSINWREL